MAQPKSIPKDGQVIMAIMKEMGITAYEPKVVVQLAECVFRYGSTVLEEARQFTNYCNKKTLEVDHVRLALCLQNESNFTMPPPREVTLECARMKNSIPLPLIKPPCGLRLPPDRYCLVSSNYLQKSFKRSTKANNTKPNVMKRTNVGIAKQSMHIARAPQKGGIPNVLQKTILKPKIQITQNIQVQKSHLAAPIKPESLSDSQESSLKRKREDEGETELG